MNSTPGSLAGLAQMVSALDARQAQLLQDLRQVERDLETTKQAMDIAARLGFGNSTPQADPRPPRSIWNDRPAREPLPSASALDRGSPADAIKVPTTDFTFDALRSLGPIRNDQKIPPKVHEGRVIESSGLPTSGPELQAVRDSVQEIAREAAAAPPGAGGRRYRSAKALVPGEPLAPSLLAVVRASQRPLSTHEAAVAMLEARGLRLEGADLLAVTNRASAHLGQQVKAGHVQRLRVDGSRQVRWTATRGEERRHKSIT